MMVDEDGDPAPTSMAVSFEQADCVNVNADPLCAYMISQDGCDDATVATGCAKMCGKCAGPPYLSASLADDSLVITSETVNGLPTKFESPNTDAPLPIAPSELTGGDLARAVTLTFSQTSSFTTSFTVNSAGSGAMPFYFTGKTILHCAPPPPPSPASPPPLMADCSTLVPFDFSSACSATGARLGLTPYWNPFGGVGGGMGQQLIYPKVGVKDGARFDVVVQTMSAYQRLDGLDEGCSGDLMSFGVAAGTSVDLQISFRNSETGDAMGPLPLFYLSAFDIDGAPLTSFALGGGQKIDIAPFQRQTAVLGLSRVLPDEHRRRRRQRPAHRRQPHLVPVVPQERGAGRPVELRVPGGDLSGARLLHRRGRPHRAVWRRPRPGARGKRARALTSPTPPPATSARPRPTPPEKRSLTAPLPSRWRASSPSPSPTRKQSSSS